MRAHPPPDATRHEPRTPPAWRARLRARPLPASWQRLLIGLGACAGALAVGVVDVVTGDEIHVVSLYFLPLMLAGWRLRRGAVVAVALFATAVWLAALYATGSRHADATVWAINFVTQGCAFVTVALLVSRLSRELEQEQQRRRTDALSGLLNRHGFTERAALVLPACRRHARSVCLAFIDLDNFKRANDEHGHAFGDALLRRCGTLVATSIRASDAAARFGGDEFVLLLPETDRAQALAVCQRILAALQAEPEFRHAGVTASIGVVVDEAARLDIDELIHHADAEMYRAKQGGRNAVVAGAVTPGQASAEPVSIALSR